MCTTCGCGSEINSSNHHTHEHHNDAILQHQHHEDGHAKARMIAVEESILSKNDRYATLNRQRLQRNNIVSFNLVSSPGSGKTTLLTKTIQDLKHHVTIGVVEGDQQTTNDAERIKATGVQAVQINTGKGCHLDAHTVGHALDQLPLKNTDLVFIENVGNLVCPAAFDLGENAKVAVLSVTEGDDKPLKYPDMFHASQVMIINKIDLLPYVDFDTERTIEYAKRINPNIDIILVSAKTGEGMEDWYQWLETKRLKTPTSTAPIL